MADRIPLIVNTAASQIQELASTDNLSFASKLLVTNSTDSTSKDTGSTIIDGGVGIEKNLHVGGTGTFTGNVTAPTFVGNLNGIASNTTLVDLNNDTGTTFRQLIFTSSNAATTGAQLLVDNTKLLKIYCHNFDKEGYLLVDFFNLDDNKSINEQLIDNDLIEHDVSKDTFSFIKL